MMWPPADSMSALNHTVSDSARRPCALRILSWSCAALTSWSQVTGCVMSSPAASATDLRYQSSCVLAQNGTATSSSFQVADSSAPWTTPSLTSRGDVVGDRGEEAGLGELGRERDVEAHDVDRVVAGREAAHQLLALRVGVAGQLRGLDRVRPVGRLAALRGDLRLPARCRG